MDDHDLDLLLGDQDSIKDDLFTTKVMREIPKKQVRKSKNYILLGMMSLGTIISFMLLPNDNSFIEFLKSGMNGNIQAQLIIGTIAICLIIFVGGFFSMIDEELS